MQLATLSAKKRVLVIDKRPGSESRCRTKVVTVRRGNRRVKDVIHTAGAQGLGCKHLV